MAYYIWLEAGGTYRVPVNPEKIKRTSDLKTNEYKVLSGDRVTVPEGAALKTVSFMAEFPKYETHYTNPGFYDADFWVRLLHKWQKDCTPVRLIASNGEGDDINMLTLLTKMSDEEEAGSEGDKTLDLTFTEYRAPGVRYVETQTVRGVQKAPTLAQEPTQAVAVDETTTYTVKSGDTLCKLSKLFYGDASKYMKIATENGIKNPNLIYPGQTLRIPK